MLPEEIKKLKQDAYELATLRELGNNPQGTRMDVVYRAMDIYADVKAKKLIEALDKLMSAKWEMEQEEAYVFAEQALKNFNNE